MCHPRGCRRSRDNDARTVPGKRQRHQMRPARAGGSDPYIGVTVQPGKGAGSAFGGPAGRHGFGNRSARSARYPPRPLSGTRGCSQACRSVLSSVYGPDNGTRPSSVTITAAAVSGAPAGAIRSAQPNQNHQSPRPLPAAVMTSAHIRLSWGFCTNRRASRPPGGGEVRGPPAGCQFRRQRVQPRQPRPARRAATVGARHHLTSLPAYASGRCRRRTPRRHRSQLWGRPLKPH